MRTSHCQACHQGAIPPNVWVLSLQILETYHRQSFDTPLHWQSLLTFSHMPENISFVGIQQMKSAFLWPYRRFRTTLSTHLQMSSGVLEMEPTVCPETSVRNYHYRLRKFPRQRSSHGHRGEILESRNSATSCIGFPFNLSFHYGLWSHVYRIIAFCIPFPTSTHPFISQTSSSPISVSHFHTLSLTLQATRYRKLNYCWIQTTWRSHGIWIVRCVIWQTVRFRSNLLNPPSGYKRCLPLRQSAVIQSATPKRN